ncbi:unnamed protein product [Rangifer tarandus platyrhynchus]|uniref:Uncharacterized protein n=2 Tax=Rangifer tarandus platyrhynchus TaxID=3082113 RepID=A0ABN8YEF3_RANTA|nr:unnamed protein product [Rangifer tarandus platyrhynchus]
MGKLGLTQAKDSLKVTQPRVEIQIKVPEPLLLVVTLGCLPGWSSLGPLPSSLGGLRGAGGHGEAGQGQEEDCRPPRQSQYTQGLSGPPTPRQVGFLSWFWLHSSPPPPCPQSSFRQAFPWPRPRQRPAGSPSEGGKWKAGAASLRMQPSQRFPRQRGTTCADSLLGEPRRGGRAASRAGRHLFEVLVLIDDNNNGGLALFLREKKRN